MNTFHLHSFFKGVHEPGRRSLIATFVIEDIVRLVNTSSFNENFIRAIQINHKWMHLGSACRLGLETIKTIATESQKIWIDNKNNDTAQTQLSFLVGTSLLPLIEQDLPLKSYTKPDNRSVATLSDEAIYLDVWLMKEIYNADPNQKTLDPEKSISTVSLGEMEEIFRLIRQRNFIRMHTNKPEFNEVEDWLEHILDYLDILNEENQRYAWAYLRPSSLPVAIDMGAFYQKSDDLIRLARGIQMGNTEMDISLDRAILHAKHQSTYAQILRNCILKLDQWQDFMNKKIDFNTI